MKLNNTQEEVANDLKIKKQTYQNYELKKREPDINTLIQLADYYNVSVDFILDRKRQNFITYISDNRKPLITQLLELSDNDFNNIETYVKGYLAGKSKQQSINFYNLGETNND